MYRERQLSVKLKNPTILMCPVKQKEVLKERSDDFTSICYHSIVSIYILLYLTRLLFKDSFNYQL